MASTKYSHLDSAAGLLANSGTCPDCNSRKILYGPEAGCAQNIECGDCGERFNVTGGDCAQRLGKREPVVPVTYSEPVYLPNNGCLVESSMGSILHSCGSDAKMDNYRDCFKFNKCRIVPVGVHDSQLICDYCHLRMRIPHHATTLSQISPYATRQGW